MLKKYIYVYVGTYQDKQQSIRVNTPIVNTVSREHSKNQILELNNFQDTNSTINKTAVYCELP